MAKKLTNAERFEAIENALGNLEGVVEAVSTIQNDEIPELFQRAKSWETLEHRVETLEANRGVDGSGSSYTPQVEQRLVAIENTQKQLGDTLVSLREEIADLAASVKVMRMALGNASLEGGASERKGKVKVPEPRPYAGERDAQKLENFLFDMDQYFQAAGIDSEESKLHRATMFLTDSAKVWWRTKYQDIQAGRCDIHTWEQLKQELKEHFYPENVEYLARRKLRDLRQTGSVQDYVKKFTTIMLDIRDMTEKDKLFFFVDGLSREAAMELQRRRVQSLAEAVTAAERLCDYDIGFPHNKKSQGDASSSFVGNGGQSKGSRTKSGGENNGSSSSSQESIASRTSNNTKKSKTLSCFLCRGPHKVADCPQKYALSALQAKPQEKGQRSDEDNTEDSEAEDRSYLRIGAMRVLDPQE